MRSYVWNEGIRPHSNPNFGEPSSCVASGNEVSPVRITPVDHRPHVQNAVSFTETDRMRGTEDANRRVWRAGGPIKIVRSVALHILLWQSVEPNARHIERLNSKFPPREGAALISIHCQ